MRASRISIHIRRAFFPSLSGGLLGEVNQIVISRKTAALLECSTSHSGTAPSRYVDIIDPSGCFRFERRSMLTDDSEAVSEKLSSVTNSNRNNVHFLTSTDIRDLFRK